jgi:hypothetical protein
MAEENAVTIQDLTDTITRPYVLGAYNNLTSKFNSPNDLETNSITQLQQSDGFTIYFTYNLFNNQSKEYYSKYKVNDAQAKLVQFNLDTRSNPDYFKLHKQQEAEIDTLTKALEQHNEMTK